MMQTGELRNRALVGILCGLAMLSAAAGAVAGLTIPSVPVWAFIGAEVVVVIAGAMGVLFWWLGVGVESPGLTLGMIGGTVLVASAIGYIGAGTASGLPLKPLLAMRAALAGLIVLGSVAAALKRDGRAWRDLVVGVALGLPGVALLAMFALPRGRAALSGVGGLGVVGGFLVVSAGFLVLTALTAASVHLVIRAFTRRAGTTAVAAMSSWVL